MNFFQEINEIISYYFLNEERNFDFLHTINFKKNISHEKNVLLLNSNISINFNAHSIIKEYKTTILNSQSQELLLNKNNINYYDNIIKIKSNINHWTFSLNKFDNIINIFNLHEIADFEKFLQIVFFALKKGGRLNFMFHSKNNFHHLIKTLINLDSQFNHQKIIQRFCFSNNFEKIESLLQNLKFQNITIVKENLRMFFDNVHDFLFNENFSQFFTKDHFLYSNHIKNYLKNGIYKDDLEVFIIQCTK
jgi:SAM-dependent methyltransferase